MTNLTSAPQLESTLQSTATINCQSLRIFLNF